MQLHDIEKMGAFFLGRTVDAADNADNADDGGAGGAGGTKAGAPLLLDERAFTTHAVCIGMTGSGKTGMCTALLEEAAIDGIPAIVVDPKGDLGALALAFPDLAPASFVPYLDAGVARRAGKTVDALAHDVAQRIEQGLADTLQDRARIQRYRDAVDVRVYTPGSSAGHALSIIGSLKAPPPAVIDDVDAFRQRLTSTTAGLLTLAGEGGAEGDDSKHGL